MKFSPRLFQVAPSLLGAFLLCLTGCDKKDQAGDWAGQAAPAPAQAPAKSVPVSTSAPASTPVAATPAQPPVADVAHSTEGTVRFVAYNVENWLTMDRRVDGKDQKGKPKPEKERLAVAKLIAGVKPDIFGVSEIGTEEDAKDLQAYLEKAGHSMPHFYLNRGADPTRSLVILSRFPIGKTVVHENLTYRTGSKEYGMQRGILDATIETPVGAYRFLGVHLKSKRETDDGDQEKMREQEAHLLRRELDAILNEDPKARLVVYGDFNDTRNSNSLRTIHGSGKGPTTLAMIALKDSRGEFWTHHWDFQDVYSRIDYVMLSDSMKKSVEWDSCKIVEGEEVASASDHRPLLVILK